VKIVRFLVVVAALCTIALCAVQTNAADSPYGIYMPPYSDAKHYIDNAVADSYRDKMLKVLPGNVASVVNRIKRRMPLADVSVVLDSSINASSSPGRIFLNVGLTQNATPAELAAVILHEQGHIMNEDLKIRYEQISKVHDSLARAEAGKKTSDKDNMALVKKVLPQIVGIFNKDQEIAADLYAWNSLPEIGYPAETMIEFFEKLGSSNKPSWVEKVFSTHPPLSERVARLKTYTPGKIIPMTVDFSMAITEIDADKFLPAFTDGIVEGYVYTDLTKKQKGIFLFLNNGKKVTIKKPGFKDFLFSSGDPMEMVNEPPTVQTGKATEMVIVVKNPTKDRHMLIALTVGDDQRIGGIPDRPDKILLEPVPKHGDWTHNEYVALLVKLPELKRKGELTIVMSVFGRVGDEAFQMTEKPSKADNTWLGYKIK